MFVARLVRLLQCQWLPSSICLRGELKRLPARPINERRSNSNSTTKLASSVASIGSARALPRA